MTFTGGLHSTSSMPISEAIFWPLFCHVEEPTFPHLHFSFNKQSQSGQFNEQNESICSALGAAVEYFSPNVTPKEEQACCCLDSFGQGEDDKAVGLRLHCKGSRKDRCVMSAHSPVMCKTATAGQPLGCQPAQPPPHPDGDPQAQLTGPFSNPRSLSSGSWQSRDKYPEVCRISAQRDP